MEQSALAHRVSRLPLEPNPALLEHARQRAESAQNRIADRITTFAGSMMFVYIHILWFGTWIASGLERYPYGLLTMIVSLEAIFLSTFVMISQNRTDAKRQLIADQQWVTVQEEDGQNRQLLQLSNQILELTKAIHSYTGVADEQWKIVQEENRQNQALLVASDELLKLTKAIHAQTTGVPQDRPRPESDDVRP
jgi:uncharacterized membrane protein